MSAVVWAVLGMSPATRSQGDKAAAQAVHLVGAAFLTPKRLRAGVTKHSEP